MLGSMKAQDDFVKAHTALLAGRYDCLDRIVLNGLTSAVAPLRALRGLPVVTATFAGPSKARHERLSPVAFVTGSVRLGFLAALLVLVR